MAVLKKDSAPSSYSSTQLTATKLHFLLHLVVRKETSFPRRYLLSVKNAPKTPGASPAEPFRNQCISAAADILARQ